MTCRAWIGGTLATLAGVLAACAGPARELARGPAGVAAPRALLDALAARFGPIEREPGFDALRPKLARAALVPSRVFDDPAWTARARDWRALQLSGAVAGGAYRIGVRTAADEPAAPGDYRGRLQLRRPADGRFEWRMDEELAVGDIRPADLASALTTLFLQVERTGEASAHTAIVSAFPRASATLGRLLRLERLLPARDRDGATRVELAVRLTPDGLAAVAPRYAAFLRRYASPMKLHAVASDPDLAGGRWWTLDASDNLWLLKLRTRGGSLAPLEGAADRGIPSRLRLTIDYETKMGLFHVGVRGLVADVELTRTPLEKGFVARFLREPDWQLPFLVAPLLRGSLRHPFEQDGSEAGWWAREQPGRTTLLVREYRARVRESWLLRWMGGLTNDALTDFRRGAEAEADRYQRDCLLALRDDLLALQAR